MNISGIKLQPGLFRQRIIKGIACSVRTKHGHILGFHVTSRRQNNSKTSLLGI